MLTRSKKATLSLRKRNIEKVQVEVIDTRKEKSLEEFISPKKLAGQHYTYSTLSECKMTGSGDE
jgi:hypothetical protein